MPNLRGKTWTPTTPAHDTDAQFWEDHLISDADAAKISSSVQTVNGTSPDAQGNVDIVALPDGGTIGQVLTKQSSVDGDADWEDPASSGHTIQDEHSIDMPYQDTLQFINAEVTNDAVNEKTVVDCKGAKGDAATITVGTVTTLPAGSQATVNNSGTSGAAVFDFGIPKGADGGSIVVWNQIQGSTGATKIAEIDIGGTSTDVYAPTGGSGGLLPKLHIISEDAATVTIADTNDLTTATVTITPTHTGTGVWEGDVPSYGVWYVHSVLTGQGDQVKAVNVDDVAIIQVTDYHFSATITATFSSGASCTCSDGTTTLTATSNPYTFVIPNTGSWTVSSSLTIDGNTNTDSEVVSITTDGQSESVTLSTEFGTINLAVDADFVTAGSTITCVNGGTSCTPKTAASSLTFRVPSTGTWTISGTISGKTYTVDATVSSLSTAVSVSLKTKALMYSFETCTDQQLADMLESYYNGAYDATDIATLKSTYMPIGAKRSISLSAMSATGVSESHHADSYDVVIIGHEHDDLKTTSSGGKTKAFLTLQLDRILYKNTTDATYSSNYPSVADEGGYMEPTNTNVNGWKNCPRRTWCNDVFLAALPAAIQSLVKTVNKLTSAGNQSATIDTTEDDVFLLSEIEIFGAVTHSKAGEGSQYEYFTTASNIQKKPSYTSYVSASWWGRSPCGSNATDFCYVNTNAAANHDIASLTLGLAPAFCI